MNKPKDIAEYLAGLPPHQQTAIENLRRQVKAAAPEVEEVIAWGVPQFKVNGKYIGGVAAYKQHVSFGPWGGWKSVIDESELDGIAHTDVTIHFTLENPLPDALVAKLVNGKIKENENKVKTKKC